MCQVVQNGCHAPAAFLPSLATTMRAFTLLPLLCIPAALAAPGRSDDAQVVFGKSAAFVDAVRESLPFGNKDQHVEPVVLHDGTALQDGKVETWSEAGREFVKQNGFVCTSFVATSVLPPAQSCYVL